jgi:hypothetical protein
VLAAPLAAVGIRQLAGLAWSARAVPYLCSVLAAVLGFMMATAPISNTDSPVYAGGITQRLTYYRSELAGAGWMARRSDGRYTADLQFSTRVLGNHLGLSTMETDLREAAIEADVYYLWRSTSLAHPVQSSGGTVIPGPRHIEEVSTRKPIIYQNLRAAVAAPAVVGWSKDSSVA